MRCSFPGTDYTTHFHIRFMLWSGPSVRHDHYHIADHTNGMPSFIFRAWILPLHHQRVTEHKLRRLETYAVFPLGFRLLLRFLFSSHVQRKIQPPIITLL